MKRLTAILLAALLVLTISVSLPAMADSSIFFTWNGISIRTLRYRLYEAKYTGSADIRLYVQVVNESDMTVSVWMENATMGGVSLVVAPIFSVEPHSATSKEDPEDFYIFGPQDNKEAARKAMLNNDELKGTLVLKVPGEDGKEKEIYREKVTISLKGLEGVRDTVKPTGTPKPKPTATPKPTARPNSSPYTPASTQYKTLKEKDKGQAVKDLQQRLADLGYYADKINGKFGVTTTIAFRDFCAQNGLTISNSVSADAQKYLYSSKAKHYEHQWLPLMIGPYCKWDNPTNSTDLGFVYVQLVNRQNKTIRGYELYYYFTNVWGEYLGVRNGRWVSVKNRVSLSITHTKTINGGNYFYDQGIPVSAFSSVYSVWIGVHKIVYSDGEIREVPDDQVVYFECPVKK